MEIEVNRKWKCSAYTIGTLSINGTRLSDGKHYCCTLEDVDRGLDSKMQLNKILFLKKPHVTAIPVGRYEVTLTYSPRFRKNMPLLNNVSGYSNIRLHPGNTVEDTDGCILVGENTVKGKVLNSLHWFSILMSKITSAISRKEKVYITIK